MASIVIRTRNIRWRLTPLSSDPVYARINKGTQLRGGTERTLLYEWDCATQTGSKKVASKVPIATRSDFREFQNANPAEARLKFKAKKLDVLTATDLSPTGWEAAVNGNFAFPTVNIDWNAFVGRHKANQSFKAWLEVKYVYLIARPQLTAEQQKAVNIRDLKGRFILIGLPVEYNIKVEFGAPCNQAAKAADISDPKAVPNDQTLAPLMEEHRQNEQDLESLGLPGSGWDPMPFGGDGTHDELEPDPSEFEDPEEEVEEEEPLNPFEEWLFELYEFIEEAEAFSKPGGN